MSNMKKILNAGAEDLNLINGNFVIDIPKDVIFPSELTEFLKEKVEYLMHENGMLKKSIAENDDERKALEDRIQKLQSKVSKYEDVSEFAPSALIAHKKIVDLSRKLREKNSELETVRTKCSKLEEEIVIAQKLIKDNDKSDIVNNKVVNEVSESNQTLEELANLKDKFAAINNKLFEAKNSNLVLKNELKLANKFLQEEIGGSFENLQQIQVGNWRGRAQIIADLQRKNLELKEKLKSYQDKVGKDVDINAKKSILEKKVEKIGREYENSKLDNQELKKKFDSLKLRFKNLDIECNGYKNKLMALTHEVDKERKLYDQLNFQNSQSIQCFNEQLKKKDASIDSLKAQLKNTNLELMQEKCRLESMEKESIEKLEEIKKLQKVNGNDDLDYNNGDEKVVRLLEADKQHLTELTTISNQRLAVEREARASLEMLLKQEKQKVAKLEAKITRLQLHESVDKCSSYSTISLKSVDKNELLEDKLALAEEKAKALQTRLEIEKLERDQDLKEFMKIFKNHNCIDKDCSKRSSFA